MSTILTPEQAKVALLQDVRAARTSLDSLKLHLGNATTLAHELKVMGDIEKLMRGLERVQQALMQLKL